MKPIIISIEGNIGSGKSSIINIIKYNFPTYKILFNPINPINLILNKKTIFDNFYHDKKRWSYTLQNYSYITKIKQLLKEIDKQSIIITKSSVLTDKYIYANMLYQNGYMTKLEMKTYLELFDTQHENTNLNGIIYLNTDPIISYNAIKKRNILFEKYIELDHIENTYQNYELWLKDKNNIIPILELDGDLDFESDNKIYLCFLSKISIFIDKLIKK